MSRSRNLIRSATVGLIFAGAFTVVSTSDPAPSSQAIDVAADDCYIVPPRGLPQPCGEAPLSNENMRDIGIVGTGCALGAVNGGGPWGCAVGAVSAFAGILWGNVAKDD